LLDTCLPISFIEDENVELLDTKLWHFVHHLVDAARRAQDDRGSVLVERRNVLVDLGAARQQQQRQLWDVGQKGLQHVGDLLGKFSAGQLASISILQKKKRDKSPCGLDDDRADLVLLERRLAPEQNLDHGNEERERLARARHGLHHHVLVGHKERDGVGLNGRHLRKLQLFECLMPAQSLLARCIQISQKDTIRARAQRRLQARPWPSNRSGFHPKQQAIRHVAGSGPISCKMASYGKTL